MEVMEVLVLGLVELKVVMEGQEVLVVYPVASFEEDLAYNQGYFCIWPWDQQEFQTRQLNHPSLAFPFLEVLVVLAASWIDFQGFEEEEEAFHLLEVVATC